MHEYSIVQSLFEQISRTAHAHRASSVHRVRVRVGELAGVEPSLLQSAYDLVRDGTMCAEAPLQIRTVPARWVCPRHHTEIARGAALECPICDRPATLLQGDEIVLDQLELEVPDV